MRSKVVLAVFSVFFLGATLSSHAFWPRGREVIFSDDFSGQENGQPPSERWSAFAGHWFVQDGTLHQDSGSFDHGVVVKDLYLRCDYRMEVKVRLVGGGSGAGFYWNLYDALTGETGNMMRYDGEFPIMFGWMRGRGFVGTGGATGDLRNDGQWHTMRMDVQNSKGTFDLYWDGKRIVDGASSFHRSGYAGLQCSLGHCEFDDFAISVKKGTDWRVSQYGKVAPEWISSLAVLPDGNIVYPVRTMDRVQIVSPEGDLVAEFGEHGANPGQLNGPAAVAVDREGHMYIAERGNNRVQVFCCKGKSLEVLTPAGEDTLKNPAGVAVAPDGSVWVADTGNNRVVRLGEHGEIVATIGKAGSEPGEFKTIKHINFIEGKLFVADSGNHRIQVFNPADLAAAPQVIDLSPASPCSVDYNGQGVYAVATWRGMSTYDKSWKKLKDYAGGAVGEIWPEQVVFDGEGNIVIGDWWSHRIVVASPELTPVVPEISEITPATAVVTWTTDLPTPTRLMLLDTPQPASWPSSVDYDSAKAVGDGEVRTDHKVELTGLKPSTRHTFAIVSPRKVIPASGYSVDYRFTTGAEEGTMAYTEVPIAILCYGNKTFNSRKNADGTVPPPSVSDEAWFEQNMKTHEAMRYFYWLNSKFRLDTKCKYLYVTRPVEFASLGSSSEEVYKDLAVLAKREKLKPTDFGAVIVIGGNCCYAYPWPTPWWGGTLTYTTGCCFAGGGDVWLSTHEFHHLTEGWMNMVRFPICGEGGYGHADIPWCHPGGFGENFDFLGHTLRYIPSETYLRLAVGKIVVTADKDGDGVPDDEPLAIFDEKRAGTSADTADSYKNGLTDLQNLTAETFHPAVKGHKHPLLTKEVDLKFPFAVLDYQYERPRKTPTLDGKMPVGEWDVFATTPNAITPMREGLPISDAWKPSEEIDYRMKTYLNWDDNYVYFGGRAPYKFHMSVQLDCNADGYFHGNDNPRMSVEIPLDESKAAPNTILPPPGVMVWNNVEPVQQSGGPNWTNDRFDKREDIKWAWGKDDAGEYVIELAIPRCEKVGLTPADGKEMSVRLWMQGYLPSTEENPNPRYAFEMFNSCEYGYFKLVK